MTTKATFCQLPATWFDNQPCTKLVRRWNKCVKPLSVVAITSLTLSYIILDSCLT